MCRLETRSSHKPAPHQQICHLSKVSICSVENVTTNILRAPWEPRARQQRTGDNFSPQQNFAPKNGIKWPTSKGAAGQRSPVTIYTSILSWAAPGQTVPCPRILSQNIFPFPLFFHDFYSSFFSAKDTSADVFVD